MAVLPHSLPRGLALVTFVAALATLTGCPSAGTPCSTQTDCQSGQVCLAGTCSNSDAGQALSDGGFAALSCTGSPSLLAGSLVGPATDPGVCQTPTRNSALPSARVKELGQFHVGQPVTFSLPQQTYGFSILTQSISSSGPVSLQGFQLDNTAFPDLLTSPAGDTYYDSSADVPSDPSAQPVFYPLSPSAPITAVMTLPNSTGGLQISAAGGGFPSGTWQFALSDIALLCTQTAGCTGGSDAGVYDVTLLTRPGLTPGRGELDVDIYLLTSDGLTRSTAPTNPHVQRMLQTFFNLYKNAGVCIGKVTFFNLPDWVRTRFGTSLNVDQDGACSDLSQLYTLSSPNRMAVPIFLVESLTTSANETVLGKDGTIPGPASVGGTVFSGAVVTAADLSAGSCPGAQSFSDCGADRVAYIAAHEVGHYLGLFHTTEADGLDFDSLSDTPHCECHQCVSAARQSQCADVMPAPTNPTQVVPADCDVTVGSSLCAGGDNLMFWSLDPSRAVGQLTGQQGSIARASPAVQ